MAKTQVRGEQILDQSVSLTADVKDTLAIANGGTGATSAAAALTALGAQPALGTPVGSTVVSTSENTSSSSYADLATTTDSVTATVGSSGNVLVIIRAKLTFVTGPNLQTYVSFAASGANTVAASDINAGTHFFNLAGEVYNAAVPVLLTGLTAGSTTFKMKYKVGSGVTGAFANRIIQVIPL